MIGHLGERASALLDGQLSPLEEERAWAHVHVCHQCRDLVEREGWVKTRLAGLSFGDACAPATFKESLLASCSAGGLSPGDLYLASPHHDARPRRVSLVALGGGAAGAAVMGVLALGAAPADAPNLDRRVPTTSISTPVPASMMINNRRSFPQP